jgi:hypothetical protein
MLRQFLPIRELMPVDYRLQSRFVASRRRYEAARLALPEGWRSDPRPEAQVINDHWVSVIAETRKHLERLAVAAAKTEHDPPTTGPRSPSTRRPPESSA